MGCVHAMLMKCSHKKWLSTKTADHMTSVSSMTLFSYNKGESTQYQGVMFDTFHHQHACLPPTGSGRTNVVCCNSSMCMHHVT